jgi:N-acyl-D-amino-acid deacylase
MVVSDQRRFFSDVRVLRRQPLSRGRTDPTMPPMHCSPLARRRGRILVALSVCLLGAPGLAQDPPPARRFHSLVVGGHVLDGRGSPPRRADVGIRDGRVTAIGEFTADQAEVVLPAAGATVAPGFLDVHAHVDADIARMPGCDNFVRMGVTTLITGNCGGSVPDLAAHFARLERGGIGLNYGSLYGHGTARQAVLGTANRAPTAEELVRMQQLVANAMDAGAFGISTGLIYVPGIYAETGELIALARVAGRHGGLYASHIRYENDRIRDALDEILEIGREAEVAVHVSHVKCTGKPNWGRAGEVLEVLQKARAAGQRVTADQYAYDASSTGLDVLFPAEPLAMGRAGFAQRLRTDDAFRAGIRTALLAKMDQVGFGDFRYARIAHAPQNQDLDGLTLAEAAERRRRDGSRESQAELAMDLFADAAPARVGMVYHAIGEPDVATFLREPWIAIAADAGLRPEADTGKPHPRGAGNNPRVLGRYVRELAVLDLPTAVQKMTSVPAAAFGLAGRGVLEVGACADLVVFDAATVADRATYAEPTLPPVGIHWVLVNGVVVVDHGKVTGARPGQVLRRAADAALASPAPARPGAAK